MRSVGLLIALSAFVASSALATETGDVVPGTATPTGTGGSDVIPVPGIINPTPTPTTKYIIPVPGIIYPSPSPTPQSTPDEMPHPIEPKPTPFNTIEPKPTPFNTIPYPNSTCDMLENKDRLGFDLTSTKGDRWSCRLSCMKVDGCQSWTWNDYEGGTCWLKSHAGKIFSKSGVWTTDCVRDTPSLVCNAYKDIDFVGMDIGNKPGKSFEDCCDICNEFNGCTAYAWNDYQGGTCWLKKSVGHVIYKTGVTSSSTVQLYGPVCPFEYDVDFVGNDIGNKPAADAGVCCSLCKGNKDCKAYSWSKYNGGTCWMKSGKGKTVSASGVISAALAGF